MVPETPADLITSRFGLCGGDYLLYVGRISPEKGVQDLIEGFKLSDVGKKLVIAGEVPDNAFGASVREAAAGRDDIIFTGFAQGGLLAELYSNCALYVLPSHTEGLALTLLEAMSAGRKCLVSDIPENTCVLGDFGFHFRVSDTADLAKQLVIAAEGAHPDPQGEQEYVRANYSYDRVVDRHMEMYERIIRRKRK